MRTFSSWTQSGGGRQKNGPRQFNFRPVHPALLSLRVRLHRRGAAVRKHRGLPREMPALHARHVAEREHHGVEAALHRGGVGTRVLLQLHHFRRDRVPHHVRGAGVEAALPPVQRTRRVSVGPRRGHAGEMARAFPIRPSLRALSALLTVNNIHKKKKTSVGAVHRNHVVNDRDEWIHVLLLFYQIIIFSYRSSLCVFSFSSQKPSSCCYRHQQIPLIIIENDFHVLKVILKIIYF